MANPDHPASGDEERCSRPASRNSNSSATSSQATHHEPVVILEEGDLEAASHTTAIVVDFDGKDDPASPRNWSLRCVTRSMMNMSYTDRFQIKTDRNGQSLP